MTNKTKSFILLFLALAILNAIPTSTEARLYGRRRTKSIKQSYQEPTMGFMDEIDRHGVGSGIDWMNGCDRKKCPCGCEPCQSGLCRCYSWCRGDELGAIIKCNNHRKLIKATSKCIILYLSSVTIVCVFYI